MPQYKRFEDLPVWNAAIRLAADVFRLTSDPVFKFRGDLVNQIRRAVLSISNNIAEGFERGTTSDRINFLYIARGSAGETRSMLRFALLLDGLPAKQPEIDAIAAQCETVSRQLHGWIDALKNTEIQGERYLDDNVRKGYENREREDAFYEAVRTRTLPEFLAKRRAEEASVQTSAATAGIPNCPVCGAQMRKTHDRNGKPFWGCPDFPRCRGSRPFAPPSPSP